MILSTKKKKKAPLLVPPLALAGQGKHGQGEHLQIGTGVENVNTKLPASLLSCKLF